MRNLALILILLAGSAQLCFSQEWRDSLSEARKLYRSGDYEKSLKYYRSAQRMAPENINLSAEEGLSAFRAGAFKDAEKSFSNAAATESDPKKKSAAYNNMGYAQMQQENYQGAEQSFKNALRIDPSNEKARQNLAEAKRIRKQKEEEEQQKKDQQQQQNNQQNQDENKDGQQDQQNKQGQNGKPGENSKQSTNPPKEGQSGKSASPKLSDKQTDRKLDELMREEMGTKRRVEGSTGKATQNGTKKDW